MNATLEGAGKRALITGSAGFTGRYVAQELRAAGYQVHNIVAPGRPVGEAEFSADLNDRAGLAAVVQQVRGGQTRGQRGGQRHGFRV